MVTCSESLLGIILPPSSPQLRLKTPDLFLSIRRASPPNRRHLYVIPSVATSCEIRRLVPSPPPAPPNRRHWISPPPSPQLRLLARYADSYLSVRRRLRIDVTGYLRPSSPQLRLLARYADLYLRLRRRLRIDVTGYLRRHPLSCDFLRDTPTRILVSVGASESTSLDISARHPLSCDFLRDTPTCIFVSAGASESTSLDISARHPLSCDFLRDTPTCIFVSAGASESTSLDISAAIPSVATSCEIRRLVS